MALVLVWLVIVVATPSAVLGQQASTNQTASANNHFTATTSSPSAQAPPSAPFMLTPPSGTNSVTYSISKKMKIRVGGPVAGPLKAKSGGDFVHRVLRLFDPFSPGQPNLPVEPSGPIQNQAWTTIVGWSPGRSAFPTDSDHEPPALRLMSVSVEKQP